MCCIMKIKPINIFEIGVEGLTPLLHAQQLPKKWVGIKKMISLKNG